MNVAFLVEISEVRIFDMELKVSVKLHIDKSIFCNVLFKLIIVV